MGSDPSLVTPIAPSVTWNGMPMPQAVWSRRWKQGGWIRHLSGTTLRPSQADAGVDAWILSVRASRVSPGALPDGKRGVMTPSGSGPRLPSAFARWDQASCSWRTSQGSLLEAAWGTSLVHWTPSGSMRNGCSFEQMPWEPRTNGSVSSSSLWPTPTCLDARASGAAKYSTQSGRHPGTTLTALAVREHRDYFRPPLGTNLHGKSFWQSTRSDHPFLNPVFVEWLMGWPDGWITGAPNCVSWEMAWSQYRQALHYIFSQLDLGRSSV